MQLLTNIETTKTEIFEGQLIQLQGNQTIWLNDPQSIWVIQSGTIALFAVTLNQGTIAGSRHYLFSASAGAALFGTDDSNDQNESRQILAVPIEETELLKLDLAWFRQAIANSDDWAMELFETWIRQVGRAFPPAIAPKTEIQAIPAARYSLNPGQTLQLVPDQIAWVQVQEGHLAWQDDRTKAITSASGIVPLSDRMWLQADDEVQLITQPTVAIRQLEALLAGLSHLHHRLLDATAQFAHQETQAEWQRIRAQERLNRQATQTAIGELASTLGTSDLLGSAETEPLLIVAGAIGKALGVTIRPPARSEEFQRVREPLEAIMRASRVRMRRVLLRDRWWQKDSGPLAAYLQPENQLVALLPGAANRYELLHPIAGTRIPVTAEVAACLNPVAHMFYRSLPDRPIKAPALLQFALRGCTWDLVVIGLTGIAASLLGMLTPQATAILIDSAIPDSDRGLLLQVGLGLMVAAIGAALFRLAQGLAILRVETVSDVVTQAAVWNRLLSLPVAFFREYTTGDLQSRVTSISQIRRQLGGVTVINLITALFALLNLVLLFYYNVQLAFVAVAVAIVTAIVTALSGILLIRKVRPLLELQGDIFGQTVQLINGISKLRVARAEERAFATWSSRYSQQVKLNLSTQHIEDVVVLFNTIMPTLTSAILFWFTIQLLTESQTAGTVGFTVGTFIAFNSAFGTFIDGAADLSNTLTNVLQIIPQAKRAQPILETIPEVNLSKADPGKLLGRIRVDRLTFRYRDQGAPTLDQVSLHAEPGEFIAIVGGSGSGKSTLFRLLLGFETPESGTIYYDGQDLAGLDVDAVRRQFGVVLQAGRIMSASIFDNIASGAQITLDEAWEAAQMAGFAEDVTAMPMGMHTVISEGGSNLSGGQRQRLLIARALVLKPQILLFDEATSALDNRTQAIVSASLDRLKVTRLVIAHRLSTIRNADRIYVLQSGRMIQTGTFTELATQPGLFAQLMARQMG